MANCILLINKYIQIYFCRKFNGFPKSLSFRKSRGGRAEYHLKYLNKIVGK